MNFNEKQGYYYEFRLDMEFIPIEVTDVYSRRMLVAQHSMKQLGEFIQQNIVKEGLVFSPDRLFIISANMKDVRKIKNFCHYLIDDDKLLNISVKNILEKFNLDQFQLDLTSLHEKFNLNNTLQKELVEKADNGKKKIKI